MSFAAMRIGTPGDVPRTGLQGERDVTLMVPAHRPLQVLGDAEVPNEFLLEENDDGQ